MYGDCRAKRIRLEYYIGSNIGLSGSNIMVDGEEFVDFGAVYNFELGRRYNKRLRLALNYQSRAEMSGIFQILFGHTMYISNNALRLNAYYDYVSLKVFSMYIGAGVGADRYDYTMTDYINDINKSEHGFAFTGGAMTGISFKMGRFQLDLGAVFDYIAKPQIRSYGPNIGLRYNF
jgi:opacity protein-like surface antigen